MTTPKFPDIGVNLGDLSGPDGNAFAIIGKVSGALKRAGLRAEAAEFQAEAMSGDYAHLLDTVKATVTALVAGEPVPLDQPLQELLDD